MVYDNYKELEKDTYLFPIGELNLWLKVKQGKTTSPDNHTGR